jgi:hypothetical protein
VECEDNVSAGSGWMMDVRDVDIGKDALFPMWYRKKPFILDVVSEKTVKFRCGVGIFRYVPFPIPERKLFLTVHRLK